MAEPYFDFRQGILAQSGSWYRCLQLLGSGGNADTWLVLATDGTRKGIPFAMKVFRNLARPERRESFLREIEFLKRCDHPAIMRVFDDGVYREYPFVVAEYLPQTLQQAMRAGLRLIEKLSYTLQLVSAIDYLAGLQDPVVHRDIKPQNIFIKGRSCVLGDFGLMKALSIEDAPDREVFKESVGPGMPFFYRTPDLVAYARGESMITPKSDVFQLGLVIAEMFTGRNPSRRTSSVYDPIVLDPLGPIPGELGVNIASVLRRMLVLDPQSREPASTFVAPWQGILLDAAERVHRLEGRVF